MCVGMNNRRVGGDVCGRNAGTGEGGGMCVGVNSGRVGGDVCGRNTGAGKGGGCGGCEQWGVGEMCVGGTLVQVRVGGCV